ncbi:MAG: hypothetical protein Kow00127_17440 [Bacteroidales bacterium]
MGIFRRRNKTAGNAEGLRSIFTDLTHLEVNTIIKEEMDARKAPESVPLLCYSLAAKYHFKLVELGNKYAAAVNQELPEGVKGNLFRGIPEYSGGGWRSFRELKHRAKEAISWLEDHWNEIRDIPEEEIKTDIRMLQRIYVVSQDIRSILQPLLTNNEKSPERLPDPDNTDDIALLRTMSPEKVNRVLPDIDLRQLMVIKKAHDIGTETIAMQTIIGMDGDVTTRISSAYATSGHQWLQDIHHRITMLSVDFWNRLVDIIVKAGAAILKYLLGK